MGVDLSSEDSSAPTSAWKTYAKTFVLVFVGIAIAIAPFLIASRFLWSGVASIAIFGVFVSTLGTFTNGARVGLGFGLLFVVLGTLAVACSENHLLAALLVAAASAGIAVSAVYGFASVMLLPAMFVPYLIHQPPATLNGAGRTPAYFGAIALTLLVAALWGTLLAWLIRRGKERPPAATRVAPRDAAVGGVLGVVVAGGITYIALTWFASTMWVWLLLTLFVLTKPSADLNLRKTRDRIVGTMVGVTAATVIALFGLPAAATAAIGVLALTVALTLTVLKKPYWIYASFMTPAIIMFDSSQATTAAIAEQRLIYTVLGGILAVLLGASINQAVLLSRRREADAPVAG